MGAAAGSRPRRDGARTRERLLAAALEEFTAKGLAGARVEAIARRAGVNVRALYQQFGGKERLYEAVFQDSFARKHHAVVAALDAVTAGERGVGDLLASAHGSLAESLAFVRLVTWDALTVDMDRPTDVVASTVRTELYEREITAIRDAQAAGRIPAALDADLLLVTLMGLAIYPSAMRPLTQIITGQAPESPIFRRRYDAFLAELGRVLATPGSRSPAGPAPDDGAPRHRLLRLAARALARAGLVTAYGHCSLRDGEDTFLVTPTRPLGSLVDEPGRPVGVEGELPDDVPGEVRVHQAIYRRRPDVHGIARVLPPAVRALSAIGRTARALDGPGSYFAPHPPLWDDPQLVRDDAAAAGVAEVLGGASAVVLRGNGAITVAPTLPRAVVLAEFLEQASRLDLTVRSTGADAVELDAAGAAARAVWSGGIEERMWQHLTGDDPEAPAGVS